ncbi:MAG TPA: nitrite/sulfite reductase [Candidatus Binataceae bacterium]|nr:nitrite/sulfite reductase [Candidatus Binataceae bacterium]
MSDQIVEAGEEKGRKHVSTLGRARFSFASQADITEFVETLERYERGELTADQWRAFRLVRGVYGQRQDDVQMFRIKVPQGVLSAAALRAVADCCEKYSRGFAHVTTRQNIQMHFVKLDDTAACMLRLAEAGVTTREACGNSVRNIVGCPFAGVCQTEAFDVSPYAEALTHYFLRHRLASSLPRKFKIAFGGCDTDCAGGAFNDLGLRARVLGMNGSSQRGFRITVGGGTATLCQSGWLLYEFLPAEQLFNVAEAILRVFHAHGNRASKANARMKYLIRKIGWPAWKKLFDEELKAVAAEGGNPLPFDAQNPPIEGEPHWERPEPPSEAEVARRASSASVKGPGIVPDTAVSALNGFSRHQFDWFCRTNVRPQRQEGYAAVTVRTPMGDLTGAQFRLLADLALAYGDGSVRTTVEQNLLMRWVRREHLPGLYQRLAAAGLGRPGADTILDVTSCPGAESCRIAVTQSRGLGRELSEFLESRPDLAEIAADASIKISGCPNGCGQHHVATLGFQGGLRRLEDGGVIPQYQLMVGGYVDAETAHFGRRSVKIPARRLSEALGRLLEWYRDKRSPGESARQFFSRAELDEIDALLADLCEISARDAKPEDYIDIGEDHAFTGETKEGECAA